MKKYKAVIFDLDGTLLNTLEDLADAVNHTLVQYHYSTRSLEEIRSFVGNGIRLLVERAVPQGSQNPNIDSIFEDFRIYYLAHCQIKTCLYPDILQLLSYLKENGYRMAIVSNKNQAAVSELRELYFKDTIATAVGEQEALGIRKKPAPDSVFCALRQLQVTASESVFVGDSEVDRETAANAGMDCVCVSWGFRDADLLKSLHPAALIGHPLELITFLEQ